MIESHGDLFCINLLDQGKSVNWCEDFVHQCRNCELTCALGALVQKLQVELCAGHTIGLFYSLLLSDCTWGAWYFSLILHPRCQM